MSVNGTLSKMAYATVDRWAQWSTVAYTQTWQQRDNLFERHRCVSEVEFRM